MIRGYAIVLFTLFLIENVCAIYCGHDNCVTARDIPLLSKLNAPLKAELDISSLTSQLKDVIRIEVKTAMNDVVENTLDQTAHTAVDRLQTSNAIAISIFRQKIEAELEEKLEKDYEFLMKKQDLSDTKMHDSLTIMGNKLDGEIEQLKGKQHFTESKLSVVESEVNRTTEIVAITSCVLDTHTFNGREIINFSDVKLSNGIENVKKFKSSGTFICEKQGIYLVGVYIMSYTKEAHFEIMKNGIIVSRVKVRPDLGSTEDNYHTGTGIIAVQLNANDTLNIQAGYRKMEVYGGGYSCLTVIKVK
ncbi:unnamed protein product [Mytilus coruscus]|uniref:C1q domain-containing protein n=1 Tax=Mytilus coruscus TaxID=42192 RepID=A0A6J8EQI6_MYTCO|nr:unnamed protein product [Mytilus coruscus]